MAEHYANARSEITSNNPEEIAKRKRSPLRQKAKRALRRANRDAMLRRALTFLW